MRPCIKNKVKWNKGNRILLVETEQQCSWKAMISLKLTQDINTVRQSPNIFMYTETGFFWKLKAKKNQPNKLVVYRLI